MSMRLQEVRDLSRWPSEERLQGLKRIIPKRVVQQVLRKTKHDKKRFCPRAPAWFMVWFVIGLGLYAKDCYRQLFRWLQPFRRNHTPGRSTLCEARRRLGIAPLRLLTNLVVRLLATPETPGAFYRDYRLMAIDGFKVDIADTEANERAFGRHRGKTPAAYPQAQVVALCEAGSHVMYKCQVKPHRRAEIVSARYLLRFLEPDMLMLWDRHYFSYDLIKQVLDQGAQVLARGKKNLVLEPVRYLDDGSYVAKIYPSPRHRQRDQDGIEVRVIEYTFTDPARQGKEEKHSLVTTLLDAEQDPADDLVLLYHMRWEEELSIDEIKTHQLERPVLRSQTPAGVVQELYGLLLSHYVVRRLMFEAAQQEGHDPRRLSFVGTLKILRCRLPECPKSGPGQRRWYEDLLAEIAEEVLEERRERINPRVIKKKMSNWKKKRPEHAHWPQPEQEFWRSFKVLY